MSDNTAVRAEDFLPVRSRISWGAIFAGAMVALALYVLLTLLGAAIGFSVSGNVRVDQIGDGAAVWAIAATLISLFVGGYVTSQCTVGESKGEAILYGITLWGVLFGMLLWLAATGVRSGFNALVGMANVGGAVARTTTGNDVERKAANVADEARRAAEDPQNQQALTEGATRVAWWGFLGTLLSMLAAMAGAWVGAGPTLRLITRLVPHERVLHREPVGRL